jgi:NAD+-dependent farnesol dehydrogenase
MRVLVTGGTGYLGGAIVRALTAGGHRAVIFARTASGGGLPGEAIDGDIRDAGAVARAAAGCDAICHTAALVSIWRPRRQDFDDVNVGGLRHVLAAAGRARIARLVYTSSFLAMPPSDGRPLRRANDYQRTKLIASGVARQAMAGGLPLVCVYPGVVYGPGAATEGNLIGRLLREHCAGRLPGLLGAARIWSFAHIDDVAEGHVLALERARPGTEYVLGGENAPQIRPFELLQVEIGVPLPRRLPFAAGTALGLVEEARARLTGRPPQITRGTVEIFRHDWALDSDPAIRDLGYRVRPLADGLAGEISSVAGIARSSRRL